MSPKLILLLTLVVAGKFFRGQHNAMEIFDVKWNIVSEISKVLLNDIFAELDGSSGIKNIISYTDRLNIGELRVDNISAKITRKTTKKLYQQGKLRLIMFF